MIEIKTYMDRLVSLYRDFARQPVTKKLAIVAALLVLTGVPLYGLFRSPPGGEAPVSFEVKKGEFIVKITELGELDAMDSITISAQIDLPVIYLAPEGSGVKKGDVLVRFDAAKYEVALEDSIAALQVAMADMRKAERELEAQRQRLLADVSRFEMEVQLARLALTELKKKPLPDELAKAEMDFEKARVAFKNAEKKMEILPELVKKGYITRDTLEKAELEHVEARANLQVAEFTLKKVKEGAPPQELELAGIRLNQGRFALAKAKGQMTSQMQSFAATVDREKANVERAGKLVDKAKVSLSRGVLTAPRDGLVVYARAEGRNGQEAAKVQLGMIPFEGQPLIYLPDLSSMVVNTEVSEFDIGKIRVGAPVEVRPEAYPGTLFRGTVAKVGTLARVKRTSAGSATGNKAFDVTVRIDKGDPRLKPGLTAIIDIISFRGKDVLFVPLTAISREKNRTVVYVSRGRKAEAREVVLGPSNEHSVIVKEGLQPGETVILNYPSAGRP